LPLYDEYWMPVRGQGDWEEYRKLILAELQRLHGGVEEVKATLGEMRSSEISRLNARIAVMESEVKIRGGIWGLIGAAVPTTVAVMWILVNK
jgi:hypothetical protein